jgi:hypothetical protein
MSDLSDEDPPELVSTDEEEETPAMKPIIGPEIPAALKRDCKYSKTEGIKSTFPAVE